LIQITKPISSGWDVILIDDIVDSGYTIHTIRKLLLDRQPRSLKTCALLDKKSANTR
jgi:hypoxanthine phosphoribosyltransferase